MTGQQRLPIRAEILDVDSFIAQNNILPVTSEMIFEPGTRIYHEDGLFSEKIFGKIGTSERFLRLGYIPLQVKVMQPIIYHTFMKLGSLYAKIIEGKEYATWDTTTNNWIISSREDPQAVTGISAFLSKIDQIQVTKNESSSRNLRVDLIEKYKQYLLTDKYLVCAAGVRDIQDVNAGKIEIEEINKLYLALMSLTKSIVDITEEDLTSGIYDSIILSIQKKVYEIYMYIFNILEGKKGYMQGKFAHRHITLGTRNVITAAPIVDTSSPHDPGYFKNDQTLVPLYQAAKAATPLVVHNLVTIFFSVFTTPSTASRKMKLFDVDTNSVVEIEVSTDTYLKYTTVDGIEKFITNFKDPAVRHSPVSIEDADGKRYLLPLFVYDDPTKTVLYKGTNIQSIYIVSHPQDIWTSVLQSLRWDMTEKPDIYRLSLLQGANQRAASLPYWEGSSSVLAPYMSILTTLQHIALQSSTIKYAITGSLPLFHFYLNEKDYKVDNLDIIITRDIFTKLSSTISLTQIPTDAYEGYYYKPTDTNTIYFYLTDTIPDTDVFIAHGFNWHTPNAMSRMYYEDYRSTQDPRLKYHYYRSLELKIDIDRYLRPITYGEILYIATHLILKDKYCTVTRYPVINQYGILNTGILVQSTIPSRVVSLDGIILPRYPIIDKNYQESMCPHSSAIKGYDGDYDGDALNMIVLLTEDATKENEEYFKDTNSMVNVEGKLHRGLAPDAINNFTYWNLSYMPA